MYVNIPGPDQKCSKCGAINQYEHITTQYQRLIRCQKCGHSKITERFYSFSESDKSVIYANYRPQEVEF